VSLLLELDSKVLNPKIISDVDGRVTYAQCNCSFFNFNKMRLGPCRHIVAVSMVNTEER
jgi:predicted nucleic acid-binding Zn finger protein